MFVFEHLQLLFIKHFHLEELAQYNKTFKNATLNDKMQRLIVYF